IAAALCLFVFLNRKRAGPEAARSKAVPICAVAALIFAAAIFTGTGFTQAAKPLARFRNFYGTLSVFSRAGDARTAALTLAHGRIAHGFQLQAAEYRSMPTAYYALGSGLDQAFQLASSAARAEDRSALRIGAVGLGVGTIAAYGRPGDSIRFYEI